MIYYFGARLDADRALGQHRRRESLLRAIGQDDRVTVVEFERTRSGRPEWIAFHRVALEPDLLTAIAGQLVFIEGLPLALAIGARVRRSGGIVVVDMCDSWLALATVGTGTSRRGRFLAKLKKRAARRNIRRVSRFASAALYVGTRDADLDLPYLEPVPALVVPNIPAAPGGRRITSRADGELCMVADWRYPPNRRMLDELPSWLEGAPQAVVRLVGPGLPADFRHPQCRTVGWVDDIADAYDGCVAALALLAEGAGVKNKVIEPLAMGLPVIASREAREGIPRVTGLIEAEHHSPQSAIEAAQQLVRSGETWVLPTSDHTDTGLSALIQEYTR